MSLSERLRPNVETAPWVVEEVKKLETENLKLRGAVRSALNFVFEYAPDDIPLTDLERIITELRTALEEK